MYAVYLKTDMKYGSIKYSNCPSKYEDKPKSCAVKHGKTYLLFLNVTEKKKYFKIVEQMVEVMQETDKTKIELSSLYY